MIVPIGPLLAVVLASSPIEGHWSFRMPRDEWQPRVCRASMIIDRDGETWQGRITFDLVLGAQTLTMQDLVVDGDTLRCRLTPTDSELIIEGRLAGDAMSGTCVWDDVEFPWTAKPFPRQSCFDRGGEPSGAFPTGDPATLGIDPIALDELIVRASRTHTDALIVVKDGQLVCERYFGRQRAPIEAMSATKSVVSLAVGLLIDDEAIESLDTPVHELYPVWADDSRKAITVRHLLTHSSGLGANRSTEDIYASADFVQFALAAEPTASPGEQFFYNNRATNLLAGVVAEASGERLDAYLERRLFEPLGIDDFTWTLDPAGNPHAMAGLQIHAIDLARIGQMMLDRGKVGDRQIVSESWVATSTRPHGPGLQSGTRRHGLMWWLKTTEVGDVLSYSADGYLGQFMVVIPEHRIVAVRQRRSPHAGGRQPRPNAGPDANFREFSRMVHALAPTAFRGRGAFQPMPVGQPPFRAVLAAERDRNDLPLVAVDPEPDQVIADIGCGSGRLTIELARRAGAGATVYARDISSKVEHLKSRATDAGVTIDVARSEKGDVKLPPDSIDVALLADVYNIVLHQAETKDAFLDSIYASMKPGGVVVVVYVGAGHLIREDHRRQVFDQTVEDFVRHGFVAGRRVIVGTSSLPAEVLEFQRPR